jgi:hypothetical protein
MEALTLRIGADVGAPRPATCMLCSRPFVATLEIGAFAGGELLGLLCRQCLGAKRSRQLDRLRSELAERYGGQ